MAALHFKDPYTGFVSSLGVQVTADLNGPRGEDPTYLAQVVGALLDALTPDQQRAVAATIGYEEAP